MRIDCRKVVRRIVKLQADSIGITARAIIEKSTASLIASDLGTFKCWLIWGSWKESRSSLACTATDDFVTVYSTAKTISLTDASTEAQSKVNWINVKPKPRKVQRRPWALVWIRIVCALSIQ
jgi:accessory colonization factor AcfC